MCFVALHVTAYAMLLHLSQDMICYVYTPGGGSVFRNDFEDPEMYQLDRNVFNTSCPTTKQWMAQQASVVA
ncbi:hypothetical protein TELCIR_23223 [Teladorsagia circumcincta]|uniref:Uncharacterized protein n=1 Tax=Teladorsagia circumcincta TaxID=45464 RepID=A0A2G9TBP7_TELCI|nr:hypothetical protein TELCIR_23223 [Teladorsagia circumcincta]